MNKKDNNICILIIIFFLLIYACSENIKSYFTPSCDSETNLDSVPINEVAEKIVKNIPVIIPSVKIPNKPIVIIPKIVKGVIPLYEGVEGSMRDESTRNRMIPYYQKKISQGEAFNTAIENFYNYDINQDGFIGNSNKITKKPIVIQKKVIIKEVSKPVMIVEPVQTINKVKPSVIIEPPKNIVKPIVSVPSFKFLDSHISSIQKGSRKYNLYSPYDVTMDFRNDYITVNTDNLYTDQLKLVNFDISLNERFISKRFISMELRTSSGLQREYFYIDKDSINQSNLGVQNINIPINQNGSVRKIYSILIKTPYHMGTYKINISNISLR